MARNFHFDLIAPFYDRIFSSPPVEEYRHVLRLPVEGDLLDAGGGTGRASVLLRPWVRRLFLCDLSFPMLLQAQSKHTHFCLQGAVDRLPFLPDTFERILVVDALHHFSSQVHGLASLLQALKPGGRLVIEEPDMTTWPVKIIDRLEKLAGMGSHMHTAAQIRQMLASIGYSSQIRPCGRNSVWIVVDKSSRP